MLSPTLFSIVVEVRVRAIGREKEINGIFQKAENYHFERAQLNNFFLLWPVFFVRNKSWLLKVAKILYISSRSLLVLGFQTDVFNLKCDLVFQTLFLKVSNSEHTVRRQMSTNREVEPHQTPNLWAP